MFGRTSLTTVHLLELLGSLELPGSDRWHAETTSRNQPGQPKTVLIWNKVKDVLGDLREDSLLPTILWTRLDY